MSDWPRQKRIAIAIGAVGIILEIASLALIASKKVPMNVGTPMLITGMLLAFVPMFLVARNARRR